MTAQTANSAWPGASLIRDWIGLVAASAAEAGAAASKEIGTEEHRAWALDLEDIELCRNGDGNAYRRIVERHQQRVGAMMWRFSRDPETHEELVQDAFVEAYTSLGNYRATAPFAHWLARIATRVGYRYWRRRRREAARPTFTLQEWDQPADRDPNAMGEAEAADLLHRVLESLPPRDRLVLTLRYVEDLSVAETAQRTGWSPSMVKVQVWRARQKLKALFEEARRERDR